MYHIGIDIGSSAAKTCIMKEEKIVDTFLMATGYSSKETSYKIQERLEERGIFLNDCKVVATGYGRVSVPYADDSKTEISCHALGASHLFGKDGIVIDIGGQDTKIIKMKAGKVLKFIMNDKCSAGTGKFLEVMANRLGVDFIELESLARIGEKKQISSMCTVFAESEVISLIGEGAKREDIACGVIHSVVEKVATLAATMTGENYFLTGGLCENEYLKQELSSRLGIKIGTASQARFAGAIGASLMAANLVRGE